MGFIVPKLSTFDIEDCEGAKFHACQFIQVTCGVLMFDYLTSFGVQRHQLSISDIKGISMKPPIDEVTDDSQYIELIDSTTIETED